MIFTLGLFNIQQLLPFYLLCPYFTMIRLMLRLSTVDLNSSQYCVGTLLETQT
jgi:hypothetical protein